MRQSQLGSVALAVHDLVLQRDAGTFLFRSGMSSLLAPVNGKVTGAVFLGNASFSLVPPTESEKHSLGLLTGSVSREITSAVVESRSLSRATRSCPAGLRLINSRAMCKAAPD